MTYRDTRPSTVKWRRLRRKDDTGTDDPDWLALGLNPNSFVLTFAGTATNGNYDFNLTPLSPTTYPPSEAETLTAEQNRVVRSGGTPATHADLAAAMHALIQADIAAGGSLEDYIKSSRVVGDTVQVVVKDDSPPFIVTTAAPAPGTLVVTPDDIFPIGRPFVHTRGAERDVTAIDIMFVVVDSSNEVLIPSGTLSFQGVQGIRRDSQTRPTLTRYGVGGSVEATGQNVETIQRLNLNGADIFGVRMFTFAGLAGTVDAVEVWYKEADT